MSGWMDRGRHARMHTWVDGGGNEWAAGRAGWIGWTGGQMGGKVGGRMDE